jgi:hypothetical protein
MVFVERCLEIPGESLLGCCIEVRMKQFLALIFLGLIGCGNEDAPPVITHSNEPVTQQPTPMINGTQTSNTNNTVHSNSAQPLTNSSSSSSSGSASSSGDNISHQVHQKIIQAECNKCHFNQGLARNTALIFSKSTDVDMVNANETENLAILNTFVLNESAQRVLNKIKGLDNHGGGAVFAPDSMEYKLMINYLQLLTGQNLSASPQTKNTLILETPDATFRRASLLLTGKIPSRSRLTDLLNADENTLRSALLLLMENPTFKTFLKRGANDQLLVRSLLISQNSLGDLQQYYPRFQKKYELKDPLTSEVKLDKTYAKAVLAELAEAPLELIAHVVQNNRPYSEILTAPYTMVSEKTAEIFKTGLTPATNVFVPAQNMGQHTSGDEHDQPKYDWNNSSEITLPHAGVLTEAAFLQQYPTTSTNRNRARALWTYRHFLGEDIEASAARTIDPAALIDTDNPTLKNPACTVCHMRLDPLAGAFQNFGERGIFREQSFGLDSLDDGYKRSKLYKPGDLWYTDMRPPGFEALILTDPFFSLSDIAKILVKDPRFAKGAVKFWWPAIFGEEFLDDGLTSVEYDAKISTLEKLANAFTKSNYDLKYLLTEMLMSDWFRGASIATHATESPANYTGGKRLLTPEELFEKTKDLSDIEDANLLNSFKLGYGGIDSLAIAKRQRNISHFMLRIAERHALSKSCAIVATEFNKPQNSRKLFTLVDRTDFPSQINSTLSNTNAPEISADIASDDNTTKIRNQISVLIERLHGRQVSPESDEVLRYTELFIKMRQNKINRNTGKNLTEANIACDYNANGLPWVQWSADPNHSLSAWRGVITALMADFNYIFE